MILKALTSAEVNRAEVNLIGTLFCTPLAGVSLIFFAKTCLEMP
jgi:hypothetical protein